MAEFILAPVTESIINKLGSQALKHIGMLFGVDRELESLQETVSIIKGTLTDAENQLDFEIPPEMEVMLSNLSNAVYDADDLVDDFHTEALRLQVMTGNKFTKKVLRFLSSSNQPVYVYRMIRKLKVIRARLDKIATDWNQFGSPNIFGKQMSYPKIEIPETISCISDIVIGREKDRDTLVELLLKSNSPNVEVISVVGMGGMGKTTTTQLVFNDQKIKTHFHLTMWVCVSTNFNVSMIAEKILERATNSKPEENLLLETLRDRLEKELTGRVYFLVLDDVWNENIEQWKRLKSLLGAGAKGSKLLLTTRSERVAEITDSLKHKLPGLNKEESWSLFHQMAFNQPEGTTSQTSPDLIAMGKKIVERCGGNALVMKTIGRLLHSKCIFEWKKFMEELSNIVQFQDEQGILRTLKLSYNYLPPHLKNCFAYCALFPEDYMFGKDMLIQLWMAQGFVQEDDGNESFKVLLWRSFFEVSVSLYNNNVIMFKMHDLMRDLARLVAGKRMVTLNREAKGIEKKTQHVSIDFQLDLLWKFPSYLQNAQKIRTFLLPYQRGYNRPEKDSTIKFNWFSSLKGLRSLDLHDIKIKSVPRSIHKLKHLRYLDISWNVELKTLPNSITKLQNLQTLKLKGCWELQELPRDFRRLINLVYLEIYDCDSLSHMPIGIGELTSLRTLSKFILNENDESRNFGGLSELRGLNNLRNLSISGLEHVRDVTSAKTANLKGKYLQELTLKWKASVAGDNDELVLEELRPQPIIRVMKIDGYKGEIPSWLADDILSCFPNLVRVVFANCEKCRHLGALSQLPCLKYLHLNGLDSVEFILDNSYRAPYSNMEDEGGKLVSQSTSFFPSLEQLDIWNMRNLMGWLREGENETTQQHNVLLQLPLFPSLIELTFWNCPELVYVPFFQKVRTLHITGCEKLMNGIEEESEKISLSTLFPNLIDLYITDQSYLPVNWLHFITTLQTLHINNIKELQRFSDIDKQLPGMKSLRGLFFGGIDNMVTLPEWVRGLRSLQFLEIKACGYIIGKRCKREIGEDWAYIKHIPHILIDERRI